MEIRPFKAYRYDPAVVGDVGRCIAPPYDVIDDSGQERLYQQSPHNIVRIDWGKKFPADGDQDNVYTRAAAYQKDWISKGVLKQDAQDSLYGYVQDFALGDRWIQRKSFIALARLEEFGPIVRPHEEILTKPMMDRLYLKRATQSQLGLVFLLYEDPQQVADRIIEKAMARKASIDFVDEHQVRHRLYPLTVPADLEQIVRMMAPKYCIIADGHHRYTTGLKFAEESADAAARYQIMTFANACQEGGLLVLPTHRLVGGIAGFDGRRLIQGLTGEFAVESYPFDADREKADAKDRMLARMQEQHDQDKVGFGVYYGQGKFHSITLQDPRAMAVAAPNMSPAWQTVDVAVLQTLILEKHLGITAEKRAQGQAVRYVKGMPGAIEEAIAQIDCGRQQVVFFLSPIKIRQLVAVTETGERMPQKSTFFYPKMYTGLTIQMLKP